MEISEYFLHRSFLFDESKNEDGFISDSSFLTTCLPGLNETKLVDTEDFNESYCSNEKEQIKINGYVINESGERLQIFLVNEQSLDLGRTEEELSISQKVYYDKHFNRAVNFVKKAIKKHLDNSLQDSSPAKALASFLSSTDGLEQIDVVEIFLLTATATVETRGESPQPKRMEFEDDTINASFTKDLNKVEKEMLIVKRLIDLNFLYNVSISQGNRESLKVDFSSLNYNITYISAAKEENFDSYLCVLPATLLAELYRKYSSRMLEKNVRSFLQLKNSVNKGMQDTIKLAPEKFIAYNNGLTITATDKETTEIGGTPIIKSLTDFQIVNGGQTTATIYFTHKAGYNIGKVRVMAKINVAKNATEEELEDLISSISTYSNAQSKVSKVDLRSRSRELVKLKSLSESILTPSGKKWFFERAKGEYSTLIRKSPSQKPRIEREYPKERRFTKEELAKFYTAWGEQPYMVKKGGEKVFRYFIEHITEGGKSKKSIEINRNFFEDAIARIILFRSMEKIYGHGPHAIGQIRSAVIPYSIAIIYRHTIAKGSAPFDLTRIWKSEGLEDDLHDFLKPLMKLMNDLIKDYSESDDYGEYSKKEELWNKIKDCKEVINFLDKKDSVKILKKYSVSKETVKKQERRTSLAEVNFEPLHDTIMIHCNTEKFYKNLLSAFSDKLKESERYAIEQIIDSIKNNSDISLTHISTEKEVIKKIRIENPEFFDSLKGNDDLLLKKALDFVIKKYNQAIESELNIKSEFSAIKAVASKKGANHASVFDEIGKILTLGLSPSIGHLLQVCSFIELQEHN
jgi:hypothetical protein